MLIIEGIPGLFVFLSDSISDSKFDLLKKQIVLIFFIKKKKFNKKFLLAAF